MRNQLLPARTDEAAIRGRRPSTIPRIGPIVATGRFNPGGDGYYASLMVACHRPEMGTSRAFSTHELVFNDERGEWGEWYALCGHYDMSEIDALADLLAR